MKMTTLLHEALPNTTGKSAKAVRSPSGDWTDGSWFRARNSIFSLPIGGPAKLLYLALRRYTNGQGTCFPSIARLSQDIGFSRTTTKKALRELEKEGLVESRTQFSKRRQTSNVYFVLHPPETAKRPQSARPRGDRPRVAAQPGPGRIRTTVEQDVHERDPLQPTNPRTAVAVESSPSLNSSLKRKQQAAVVAYREQWNEKYGTYPDISPRDASILTRLCEQRGVDEYKTRLLKFIGDDDPFLQRSAHPPAIFESRWNSLGLERGHSPAQGLAVRHGRVPYKNDMWAGRRTGEFKP